jgi:Putative MetA-pathway of phenol degradation
MPLSTEMMDTLDVDEMSNSMLTRIRFLGSATLIGLPVVVLGASVAFADQCPQKESPIATDRPDVTNSSIVLPQGSFQSENGINFTQRDAGHEFDGTNSRLRWGVAPCLEILVDVPNYFAAVNGPLNSGFTNVTPAIKWQISPVPGKIDLSGTLGAGLPTGTKAIAGSGVQPYVQFPWSLELSGGWGVSGMFTNFIIPADPINKLSAETTFVLEREIAERAFLFIEYVGDYHVHGGPSYLFNSGGGYRITPTQQIDFHIGVGLNDNAPAYIVGIGYSFRTDSLF